MTYKKKFKENLNTGMCCTNLQVVKTIGELLKSINLESSSSANTFSVILTVVISDYLYICGTHNTNIEQYDYKDMEISLYGYVIYTLIGHSGEFYIVSVESREDAERRILSENGLKNMFVSEILVFLNGDIKKYHISKDKDSIVWE